MKIVKIRVKGLPLFKETLEIDFYAQQRVTADKSEGMYKLFSYNNSSIYLNNVMGVVGINASGKTSTLKVLAFVIDMLNNKPLNNITNKEVLNGLSDNETVQFETFFYCENGTLNKIETIVKKCVDEQNAEEKYVIEDETVWSKAASKIKTKKSMFKFDKNDFLMKRENESEFLLEDVSISIGVMKKFEEKRLFFLNMLDLTNKTRTKIVGNFPVELIEFLDPSLEWIKCEVENLKDNGNRVKETIQLKFKDKKEIILRDSDDLNYYLSSGTIKGINIFMNAMMTFQTSGYLIVDELENHFNKEIVSTLIRFFMDSKVNPIGGTLIFSTHYAELLDIFERNDSIYIARNRKGVIVENLSKILNRNDIKKSDAYESGYLEGTVPLYDAYMRLKKILL